MRCNITLNPSTQLTITRNVAVVGGKITFGKVQTAYKDPSFTTLQPLGVEPPWHDSQVNGQGESSGSSEEGPDKDKTPVYIQYFNKRFNVELEDWEQAPQRAGVSLTPQPDGTTIQWELPDYVELFVIPPIYPFPGGNLLSATGSGSGDEIKAEITIVFEGTTYVGFEDDTEDDPEAAHEISSHMPGSLTNVMTTPGNHLGGIANKHSAKRHDHFQLKDTAGYPMPGVLVQERFTALMPWPYVPPNWVVNGDGQGWKSYWTNASLQLRAGGWTDHEDFHTASSLPGTLDGWDNISLIWHLDFDDPNDPPGNWTPLSATHKFWAGTWSATGTAGVEIATYVITFEQNPVRGWRGNAYHSGG